MTASKRVTPFLIAAFAAAILALAVLFFYYEDSKPSDHPDQSPTADAGKHPSADPGAESERHIADTAPPTVSREPLLNRVKARDAAAIEGPAVSGMLRDSATGGPPEIDFFQGELWEVDRSTGSVERLPVSLFTYDDDGRFVIPLAGVPVRADGLYALVCDQSGYVVSWLEDLAIDPARGLSGLVVDIVPNGRVHITGSGFVGNGIRSLGAVLTCRHRPAREVFWKNRPHGIMPEDEFATVTNRRARDAGASAVTAAGVWEQTIELEPGLWEAEASIGIQRLETFVSVAPGRTTELVIDRGDIGPAFTILGTLKYDNGDPIPGAVLRFQTRAVSGRFRDPASCTTGASGDFMPLDLLPGVWSMSARLEDGGVVSFPRIVIPRSPSDPHRLDLVVHRGTVSGTLCDQGTNLPFGDDYTRWFLLLRDTATSEVVAELVNHFGSDFRMTAVPAGEMRLEVRARGFADWTSRPFRLEAGGDLDLGDVCISMQEGEGTVIVAVTDEQAAPFGEAVNIEVLKSLGREGSYEELPAGGQGYSWTYLGANVFRLDGLPARKLIVRISPRDSNSRYASCEKEVEVRSGEVLDLTVILERN